MCELWNGDCIPLLRKMPDESVDMVLTDIPYGEVNEAAKKQGGLRDLNKGDADDTTFPLDDLIVELHRVCKGSVYIFCGIEQVSHLRGSFRKLGWSTRLCVWEKTNPSPMNGTRLWLSGIECCVYAKKPKATFNEKCKNVVWKFPNGRRKVHPTEKPLALFKYLVEASSNPGDTVLDCCMGSGTTGEAALSLGRNFIGMEINEEYFNYAKERLLDFMPRPLLLGD